MTDGILQSIKTKNNLYHKSITDPTMKPIYIGYKNKLCKVIRLAKQDYHQKILNEFKNKSAKMWAHLNTIIKSTEKNSIPLSSNVLNDFFTSVFKQAPVVNDNIVNTISHRSYIADSFYLNPITCNEIATVMLSISNSKAVGSDGFSPIIIKQNINAISKQLEYIFNLSFSSGIFPKLLKSAIVTPIYKSGSVTEPGNYRPISILTIFSKLLEKLYYNRLLSFIDRHNILHAHQFGFRKKYSTGIALAHVISTLISKINSGKPTVLALLDLKKAFDLINHKLLLIKLNSYGIRGLPLQWLSSYLTNRTQKTKVNNVISDSKPISAGVPQGSILGTIIFILFVNDVFQLNSIDIEIFLYADDTAIIFSADCEFVLQTIINNFFDKYCLWCTTNCLVLNPAKSNFLTFNNARVTVSINNQLLLKLDYVKYLGILIDNRLNWSYHVNHIVKIVSQRIGMFKRVLPFLPKYVVQLYYNAFILPSFSYCLMYWFNNDRSGRYKLINKIDSLIGFLNKHQGDNDDFVNKQYTSNVYNVYRKQCLSFMFDICNNTLTILHFPLVKNNFIHLHNTRTSTNLHINTVTTLDQHNFIYNCILFWNSLPFNWSVLTKYQFKIACKCFLSGHT